MTAPDLLPCPLCGGPAEIWQARDQRPAWIACVSRCLVLTREHSTTTEAAAAWNTRADLSAASVAQARREALEEAWQPIETAPREPVEPYGSAPILLLASARGHRALGYWGKGARNTEPTWISLHDHRPISYWNAIEFWMHAPEPPAAIRALKDKDPT